MQRRSSARRSGAGRTTSSRGLPSFPAPRPQGAGGRAGDAAVADRRRASMSSSASMRVPLEFRNIPASWRSSAIRRHRRRAAARLVGAARPARAAARSSPCSTWRSAGPGSRLFHLRNDEVRAPFGVEVVAGVAGHRRARAREVGQADACRWCRPSMASRRPASCVGRATAEPATVEVVGPESRVRPLTEATTEPVGCRRRAAAASRDDGHGRRGRLGGPARKPQTARRSPSRSCRRRSSASIDGRAGALRATSAPGCRPGRRRQPRRSASAARREALEALRIGDDRARSSTLPGSAPAGTICGSRSSRRSTSASPRSRRASSRSTIK